jgi:lipoic acid synthetase
VAKYERSLELLRFVKQIDNEMLTKSGFMVGLGETEEEVYQMLDDLRKNNVDIVTIGQYMQPSIKHYPVHEYVHPEVFKKYKEYAINVGFKIVESAPLVRSSYQAEKARELLKKRSVL